MKQVLNASGSAYVQANELAQSPAALAASMVLLESNFDQWMDERFALSVMQQTQIANMDPTFKSTLAEAIARELRAGRSIAFAKAEHSDNLRNQGELRDKDVYIFGSKQQSYSFGTSNISEEQGLQIVIRYR